MNISPSDQWRSGCESGWTTYLNEISNSTDPYKRASHQHVDEDDDQDLSMVSDASSGPPHIHDQYGNCEAGDRTQYNYGYVSEDKKKKKKKKTTTTKKKKNKTKEAKGESNLYLDDTASSSIFHFSQDNVPPCDAQNYSVEDGPASSQVFSSAHFEGESITKKHFGFFKPSTKGKSGSLLGRKRQ